MITKIFPQICELMKHKVANNVVETFYNEYASAPQRNRMLQEFCGPEFRVFKEETLRTVPMLIEKHLEKKRDIVKNLGTNVQVLVKKGCYNHSLVHTVIYNYLQVGNSVNVSLHPIVNVLLHQVCGAKQRTECVESLRDVCLHILHSHDGSRATMACAWHGTAKDRKAIVKSLKTFVTKTACEEQGHLALLAVLDSVDDTKLVGKALLGEVAENIEEVRLISFRFWENRH